MKLEAVAAAAAARAREINRIEDRRVAVMRHGRVLRQIAKSIASAR